MKIDIGMLKKQIIPLAKKYQLKLVLLYGSQATNRARKDSDLDIAVLGEKPVLFDTIISLNSDLMSLLRFNEIDVKSLHRVDSLFRYQVTKNAILLYGDLNFYQRYQCYAFQDYIDSGDLFQLKKIIINKRLKRLEPVYSK